MGWEDLLSQELVRSRFTSGRCFAFLQDLSQASDAALRADRVTRAIEARKHEVNILSARFATLYLNASPGRIALSHSEWREGTPAALRGISSSSGISGVTPLFIETVDSSTPYLAYMISPPLDLNSAKVALSQASSSTPRFVFTNLRPDSFSAMRHLTKDDVSRIIENLDYVMVDILDNASRLIWERPDMPHERSVIPLLLDA